MSEVKLLSQLAKSDIPLVGAKAANLSRLLTGGLPVPPGFVITALDDEERLTPELQNKILTVWDQLGLRIAAVRSSAIGEDDPHASWAGQLKTCLAVNKEQLFTAIESCQQSLKRVRAQAYSRTLALSPLRHICLLVQEMIPSELSGVLFTAHPITGDKGCLVIETVLGLGELLVQGDVDVSHYELHTNGTIISSVEPGQDEELILVDNMLQRIHLPSRPAAHLSPQQLHELSQLGVQTENIFGMPQDIEWAMANGKYWLLQARPITTL